jgi:hypothetical protein
VTRVLSHQDEAIFAVSFNDGGESLRTTAHHSFLTRRGWVKASALRVGDRFVHAISKEAVVSSVAATGKSEKVYNLYTAIEHNFIVDGVVAHNFTFLRRFRTLVHRLLFDVSAEQDAKSCFGSAGVTLAGKPLAEGGCCISLPISLLRSV